MKDIFGYPIEDASNIIVPVKKSQFIADNYAALGTVLSVKDRQAIVGNNVVKVDERVMVVDEEFAKEYLVSVEKHPWYDRHKVGNIVAYHSGIWSNRIVLGHISTMMTCGFTITPFPEFACSVAYRDHTDCIDVTTFMFRARPELLV